MTTQKKRQVYKDGMIVAIPIADNKYTYGIALYKYTLAVYDYVTEGIDESISWELLKEQKEIFQMACHKSVFSAKGLLAVKYDTLTQKDVALFLKPRFWQSSDNFMNCEIFYADSRVPSRKATPAECIGLESGIPEVESIIERAQCFYKGKKYWSAEYTKVILSADDVRLKPNVRWDKDKEEWILRE
jgi:hypothetical protein